MCLLWGSLAGLLLYLEIVYHVCGFGFSGYNPIYTIFLIMAWTAAETLLIGLLKNKWKKRVYGLFVWLPILWTAVQLVYYRIFKQPLLWEALIRGGQDALTNYWREALLGVKEALPCLLFILLPGVFLAVLLHSQKWKLPEFESLQILRTAVIIVMGTAACVVTMQVGKYNRFDYYEEYTEFFDPLIVAQKLGVFPLFQRDTAINLLGVVGANNANLQLAEGKTEQTKLGEAISNEEIKSEEIKSEEIQSEEINVCAGDFAEIIEEEIPKKQLNLPYIFDIDFEKLHGLADNKTQSWLADYIENMSPTTTNQYTGMFEGYNLIYITAEGFSPYAVREDLTPTLYKLINSGFVFENYYVPLWQTSTSDGEYINCTGLIPDGQFSMRKSGKNNMAFTLPRFFEQEGVASLAYHNNSLSYYDRYLTHPNLGYDFRGCRLGNLSEAEWGDKLFPMENPKAWPASDLEMMQGSLPQYLNEERFHVYYLTVSGHMYYTFSGNAMSYKNREAVKKLEMSENARAYIACQMELDQALEYLLEQLKLAGKLENTVICMSADHYPYAMTEEQYEELAAKDLSQGMDKYRNNLILWNAGMKEPVPVTKVCGSMDIVPTLLNLFGYSYDSRMYAGKDIFSRQEGMVIFNDRSFVTDSCIYTKQAKEPVWLTDREGNFLIPKQEQETYLEAKKQEVKDRYQFSAYILQENYYQDIEDAIRR